jgi:hypothetical protein
MTPLRALAALLLFCGLAAMQAGAQNIAETDTSALPDAPSAVLAQQQSSSTAQNSSSAQTPAADSSEGKQTKRILGIVPNFRSVSANVKLPPQTVKEKFIGTMEDSFDYSSFIFVGLLAGVDQIENNTPEFHQGAAGYGRYYWHTFADQTNENLQVEFLWPVATHEDPRYYTLGHGGFLKRTAYSFSRIIITRTDSGHETFNASEVGGAGAAAGISDFYYPSPERTWTKTGQRWVLNMGLDGATFIFKEFWPDINGAVFHQKD